MDVLPDFNSFYLGKTTIAGTGGSVIVPVDVYQTISFAGLNKLPYGLNTEGNWLMKAEGLEVLLVSQAPGISTLANRILETIRDNITVRSSDKRLKDTLKCILINLYHKYLLGVPIRYSRDRNFYSSGSRYSQIFFNYDRIINLVDALLAHGFINHKEAVMHYHYGKQSRMWASAKLTMLFDNMEVLETRRIIERNDPPELIQLKVKKDNKKSRLLPYKDTGEIVSKRKWLKQYNEFISQQDVTIRLSGEVKVSVSNMMKLYNSEVTRVIDIKKMIEMDSIITRTDNNNYKEYEYIYNHIDNIISDREGVVIDRVIDSSNNIYRDTIAQSSVWIRNEYDELPTNFCTDSPDCLWASIGVTKGDNRYRDRLVKSIRLLSLENDDENAKFPLYQAGISSFELKINCEKLYRVFSRGSFKCGGRFYGGFHETMPKQFRPYIWINEEKGVELDYSAHHIRMLYHLKGIGYLGDPYLAMTENEQERDIYKLLALVIINCKNKKEVIAAFREKARQKKWSLSLMNEAIIPLIERFKCAHEHIADYLHSDIGASLQNLDSQITEGILKRLMNDGIQCLPVHDSYIVQEQYKDKLKEVMIQEYVNVMGFEPVIG